MRATALFLLATALHGDALDELRRALRGVESKAPLSALAEKEVWSVRSPAGAFPVKERASARVEAGKEGSRVVPTPPPASKRPSITAADAQRILNAAEPLQEALREAKMEGEFTETWQGLGARRLRIALPKEPPASGRKGSPESSHTLDVWVGPDGLPLATLEEFKASGRFAASSFEGGGRIQRVYRRVQDRLVMVREEVEGREAALGRGF